MAPRKFRAPATDRGAWKGAIAFGLVHIPIYLISSLEPEQKISFRLLDKKDYSPVGYKNYNKRTGEDIPRQRVIKGFELSEGKFVTLDEKDFEKAYPKSSRTIDIEDFVKLDAIDPMLFERPYYVAPQPGGEKGYLLLRDVLARTHKVGIAKMVLHSKQHLVALMSRGDYVVLELLRFADEVKSVRKVQSLDGTLKHIKISPRELTIAEELVNGMTATWEPEKYRDTYREDMMKLIKHKAKRGSVREVEEVPLAEPAADANVIDLTSLLKRSLAAAGPRKRKKAS